MSLWFPVQLVVAILVAVFVAVLALVIVLAVLAVFAVAVLAILVIFVIACAVGRFVFAVHIFVVSHFKFLLILFSYRSSMSIYHK